MPLEICKIARQNRVKICSQYYETAPAKGFCASQNTWFYFHFVNDFKVVFVVCASQNTWFYGYKLHRICSISGVFHTIDITKANVHDSSFLKDIKHKIADCVLLDNKEYLFPNHQIDLFNQANIKLETPRRANQLK